MTQPLARDRDRLVGRDSMAPEKRIWRADVVDGELVYLRNGFTADEVAEQLIEMKQQDPRMVVGLDFAFSMPAWFLEQRRIGSAHELWAMAADGECERWLDVCGSPFWGRAGSTMPRDCELYRRTERDVEAATGFRPKSVFQIGGAGAVGTASLRGMPILHRLRSDGFRIWPYDDPGWPLVLEIYPRVFTGRVQKSNETARRALVADRYPGISLPYRDAAAASEDAFDAAVSALEMWRHTEELSSLPPPPDEVARVEGLVWFPGLAGAPASEASSARR